MDIKQYCRMSIDTYGQVKTEMKIIEELAELIQATCKRDKKNIIEELADSYIMMEQLKEIHLISDEEVNEVIKEKTARQRKRMSMEGKND